MSRVVLELGAIRGEGNERTIVVVLDTNRQMHVKQLQGTCLKIAWNCTIIKFPFARRVNAEGAHLYCSFRDCSRSGTNG